MVGVVRMLSNLSFLKGPTGFSKPVYVTRPTLPDLPSVLSAIRSLWQRQWLTNNGVLHQQLEAALTHHLGVPYLSLFNNGTLALMTAFKALNITHGEVITTPFTFPATVHVLDWLQLTPVFCDIDPETMNLDPSKIERLITPQTRAILGVHVYGTPCDVEAIEAIASRHGIKVIYDAAHAFGVSVNGQGIGTYGDASMMSFHATKLYHTVEGGALMVPTAELKTTVDLLKNFGISQEDAVVLPGINGKMNELQAMVGLETLKTVEDEIARRKQLSAVYRKNLSGVPGISFLPELPGVTHNYQYFVVKVDADAFGMSRDAVYEKLKAFNVFTRRYFYPLCSNYPHYTALPSAHPNRLPVANAVSEQVLCLPMYGQLREGDVEKICALLGMLHTTARPHAKGQRPPVQCVGESRRP